MPDTYSPTLQNARALYHSPSVVQRYQAVSLGTKLGKDDGVAFFSEAASDPDPHVAQLSRQALDIFTRSDFNPAPPAPSAGRSRPVTHSPPTFFESLMSIVRRWLRP